VPAAIVIWRLLSDLGTIFARRAFIRFNMTKRLNAADAISVGAVSIFMMITGVWLVTQLLQMMPVDDLTSPVSALVMALSVASTATLAMKIHLQMDSAFRRTLLGDATGEEPPSIPADGSASAGD
jgi:hypothetical protein